MNGKAGGSADPMVITVFRIYRIVFLISTLLLVISCGEGFSDSGSNGDIKPKITVEVLDVTAWEPGEKGINSGCFLVRRTGKTGKPLKIFFKLEGTATHKIDYKSAGSAILIQAGQDSVKMPVGPVADTLNEGDESVQITLSPDPSYTIGSFSSVRLVIQDSQAEYSL
jgi:hypothetical protein